MIYLTENWRVILLILFHILEKANDARLPIIKKKLNLDTCYFTHWYSNPFKRWNNYLTFSLSKCLKYPGFIFLCPQKLSKKNPRKITKSLNYPNTIPEFFSEFAYVQDFFYVPRTIRGKKTNTLNYPILFWNIAKFFQIVFRYFKHLDRLFVFFLGFFLDSFWGHRKMKPGYFKHLDRL